jgi:hypothetical protein
MTYAATKPAPRGDAAPCLRTKETFFAIKAELGRFSDPQPEYNLDEATCNRLIAHGREDVVHVLMVALRLTSEVKELKRLVWTLVVLFVVFLLLTELACLFALSECRCNNYTGSGLPFVSWRNRAAARLTM